MDIKVFFNFKTLRHYYRMVPRPILLVFFPVIAVYRFLKALYSILRVDVWILNGKTVTDGEAVAVFFSGHPRQRQYYDRMVFGGQCEEVYYGKQWVWQLPAIVRAHRNELDLVVHETHHLVSRWMGERGCICAPTWINGDMDLSLIDPAQRSLRSDIINIHKQGFTYEVTADNALLKTFHAEMYLPYVLERYAPELITVDYEVLVRLTKHIELLWVKKDGERVAGIMLCYKGHDVILKCLGVRPGSEALTKAGVIPAMYYFLSSYLKDRGGTRIVHGGCRSLFRDGVFTFKRKWGFRITGWLDNALRIYPVRDSRGLRSFLMYSSIIAFDRGELVGMVFVDKTEGLNEKDIQDLYRYRLPGLKRVVVYLFERADPCSKVEAVRQDIELRDFNNLLGPRE